MSVVSSGISGVSVILTGGLWELTTGDSAGLDSFFLTSVIRDGISGVSDDTSVAELITGLALISPDQ